MTNMINYNIQIWLCSILLAIGSILLFFSGPDSYSSRSFKHIWDIGHIFYFALLTYILLRWRFLAQKSSLGQWVIVLGITLLVGISIEYLQSGTDRTPDIGDIFRDITGSLLVLTFKSSKSVSQRIYLQLSMQAPVLFILLFQLWPLSKSMLDEAIAMHQFPILSNFETPFEIDRWRGNAILSVESIASISRGKLLKISMTTDQYSGIGLQYFNGNWISFRALKISLYNPEVTPMRITCRIHDLLHIDGDEEYEDRFNRSFFLKQGWNHIEINLEEVEKSPADRVMDMSQIRGLGIFAMSLSEPKLLYMDNAQLTH